MRHRHRQSLYKALAAMVLVLILATACSDGESSDSQSVSPSHAAHGDGPLTYDEPRRVTEGEYIPPSATDDEYERGLAAADEDASKPRFVGTVNGIRLYPIDAYLTDPSLLKIPCGGDDYHEFREVSFFHYEHLPPGTLTLGPQSAAVCPDGSIASFSQEFLTQTSSFDIWFSAGELAFAHDAPEDRISEEVIAGKESVVIRPLTEAGFGRSWVVMFTGAGVIILDARDLPLEEVLRIATGISCDAC